MFLLMEIIKKYSAGEEQMLERTIEKERSFKKIPFHQNRYEYNVEDWYWDI